MDTNKRLTELNDQLNDRYVSANEFENVITYPKLISLTITHRCNYRCMMCYQPEYKGDLDWRIVEKLKPVLPSVKTLQLFGGEPLVYKRLDDLCHLAGDNYCEIELVTNGSLLDQERRALFLDNHTSQIKVSLEAATQKTYEAIRGGNLNNVLSNVENLVKEREQRNIKDPSVQINFVAMENNIRELPDLIKRAGAIGVDSMLVLFMNAQGREELARQSLFFHQDLSDEYMAKAIEAGDKHGVNVTVPDFFSDNQPERDAACIDRTCHSPWKSFFIYLNGSTFFCCGQTGGPLGSLFDEEFDDLWFNQKISRFRKLVNTTGQPECCNTCRSKGRNIRDIGFHIRDPKLAERMLKEYEATTI